METEQKNESLVHSKEHYESLDCNTGFLNTRANLVAFEKDIAISILTYFDFNEIKTEFRADFITITANKEVSGKTKDFNFKVYYRSRLEDWISTFLFKLSENYGVLFGDIYQFYLR